MFVPINSVVDDRPKITDNVLSISKTGLCRFYEVFGKKITADADNLVVEYDPLLRIIRFKSSPTGNRKIKNMTFTIKGRIAREVVGTLLASFLSGAHFEKCKRTGFNTVAFIVTLKTDGWYYIEPGKRVGIGESLW